MNTIPVRFLNDPKYQICILLIALYLFCDFEYNLFIAKYYLSAGFEYHFSLEKNIISKLLMLFSLFYLFVKSSEFIKSVTVVFHATLVIPNLVLFQYMDLPVAYLFFIFIFIGLLNYSGFYIPIPKSRKINDKQKSLILVVLALLALLPFLLTFQVHFNLDFLKMGGELYDVRREAGAISNVVTRYLFSPLFKIILPLVIVYGLRESKFLVSGIGVACIFLLFFMLPHKSVFFAAFVVLFFYFTASYLKKTRTFLVLFVALLFFTKFLHLFAGNILPESIFYRRFLMLPAFLNILYFEQFVDAPIYFSHSIFKSFIDYPHTLQPSNLIGLTYGGNPLTNANNGFLSDGFMNLGYFGMALFTLFVTLIFKFFDALKIPPQYFGIFFLIIGVFNSAAFFTSLLTHGLILFIIIAYFFLNNSKQQLPNKE